MVVGGDAGVRFPHSSPFPCQQDAAHGAVYRPMNDPEPTGEAGGGQRPFSELQGSGLPEREREAEGGGKNRELCPGKPVLQA